MISLKKDNVKEMADRQLSSNEIEKVLELQNSTLLRRLPGFGFPDFGIGPGLGGHTEDSDITIFSNQKNVENMLEQQKIIQNLLKHYHKNLSVDGHWLNSKNTDLKCKKRFSAPDFDVEKRRDMEKPVKENIPMEEVKNKLKLKKDEDGKVFSKQRKTNFTSKEVETLLDCVRKKKEVILFGVAGGRGWAKAWQDIAKVVTKVEGIPRSEGDVRKKWTYLKWEAKNTSKPGRDPVSKQVLNILTSRDREVQEAMNLRNLDFPDDVGSIWKARDKIKSIQSKSLKKIRRPAYENLDSALIKWFREQKMLNLPCSGASLKTRALELAKELEVGNFECSNGWIDRFKKRHDISFAKGSPGEESNVDVNRPEVGEGQSHPEGTFLRGDDLSVPPANPAQQQHHQQQQQTPQASPQSQPQLSPPPSLNQKKSGLPPLAPKPSGPKLPQSSAGSSATIKQLPKLLPKPQSPPEVCLRWNSYHSNMQNTFPSLLNNEQFVDVTLACDGRSIKCHKVMLSACSPYMEELLSSNPCQHPIIFLKDMKFWQLQALIDFMYRGEVNVTQDKLPSLLSAAEALQIKGLASPVNHNAPPKISQVQPMPSAQHDLSEEMDQITYMRHLQLQTDVKNEYDDEYMQDTDESPPPTPKAKKRKTSHVMPHGSASGGNSGSSSSSSGNNSTNSSKQQILVNRPKREKERHSEPSTSHHQITNSASSQALPNQHGSDHQRKSDNIDTKMTDSENEYKVYSEGNRHSTTQDDELDIDEEHAQIILERYSSQNDEYPRGVGGGKGGGGTEEVGVGDGDPDGDNDDNSTTSG